ncbi:MAG: polysaccharide deacetylase family protein [Bacteroidota bacterium]
MRNTERLYELLNLKYSFQQSSIIPKQNLNRSEAKSKSHYFAEVSEFLHKEGFRPEYPEGKTFALCVSHDIDLLYNHNTLKGNLFWGSVGLLSGNQAKANYHFSSIKNRKINESWRIEHTLELLNMYQAKSSFYFLALEPAERDFNYRLEQLRGEIAQIQVAGHEIGLHGGHDAYDDIHKMKEEKDKLESFTQAPLVGYRSHFLNLNIPQTWEILEDLDFRYDATLGFSREVGFRNGMCYPYRFRNKTGARSKLFIFPLMIMDVALFLKKNSKYDYSLELCKIIIARIQELNGVCTFLWHNNYMQGKMGDFFREIMEYSRSLGAWMPTHQEYLTWWKEKGYEKQMEGLLDTHIYKHAS